MKIEREQQKAQEPSRRVGQTQSPRVPTHEGSQLTSFNQAGVQVSKTPHTGANAGKQT
jgi:hypothetical protein